MGNHYDSASPFNSAQIFRTPIYPRWNVVEAQGQRQVGQVDFRRCSVTWDQHDSRPKKYSALQIRRHGKDDALHIRGTNNVPNVDLPLLLLLQSGQNSGSDQAETVSRAKRWLGPPQCRESQGRGRLWIFHFWCKLVNLLAVDVAQYREATCFEERRKTCNHHLLRCPRNQLPTTDGAG